MSLGGGSSLIPRNGAASPRVVQWRRRSRCSQRSRSRTLSLLCLRLRSVALYCAGRLLQKPEQARERGGMGCNSVLTGRAITGDTGPTPRGGTTVCAGATTEITATTARGGIIAAMPRDIRVVGVSCITVTDGDRARRCGLRQSIREAPDSGHSAVREPLRMTTQCRLRSGSRERQYIPNPLLYPVLVSSQARTAIIIIG